MNHLEHLKSESQVPSVFNDCILDILFAEGYCSHFDAPSVIARAHAIASAFSGFPKHVYPHDRILGSCRGLYAQAISPETQARAKMIRENYGDRWFRTNSDHFAPDYVQFLQDGIPGTLERIRLSKIAHQDDPLKVEFLEAAAITMTAFSALFAQYADAAEALANSNPETASELLEAASCCRHLSCKAPETFRQALQLVWMCHIAFKLEYRGAMAFGRMDQFLYPFYQADLESGRITREDALDLLSCALYKLAEMGRTDVHNIAIGGVKRDGSCAVNDLSYLLLEAVKLCAIPGPNLSARIHTNAPDAFLDACLQVIGTGIGYPALMNDEINIPALARFGYALEDCRDYSMVGCIENFITGKQPPWSDGRFNSPKYLELALNDGKCMQTGMQLGPHTGSAETISSMEEFLSRLVLQMKAGAAEYMALFRNDNDRYNRLRYQSPFLSCFCQDCIGRGLDINNGGTVYPSVHGAGCMGIATVADSLAAMEKLVFRDKTLTITQLRDALQTNFEGLESLRKQLLNAPKYGNDDPEADKYAVWYVKTHADLFDAYRTPDGGGVYIAIAANVQNISAGREVAATADGRRCGEPLSDAASPMRGMDKAGPTAVVLSTTKPDYTLAACGTVLNQKYSPIMFSDPGNRAKLLSLIRVYFARGGQEMQINSVSRKVLTDAMEHPENYESLVVRVSGFSEFYTRLDDTVKLDILQRTEQE